MSLVKKGLDKAFRPISKPYADHHKRVAEIKKKSAEERKQRKEKQAALQKQKDAEFAAWKKKFDAERLPKIKAALKARKQTKK